MIRRFAVPILCAAAIAFACGPRSHTGNAAPAASAGTVPPTATAPRQAATHRSGKGPVIASSLDVSVAPAGGSASSAAGASAAAGRSVVTLTLHVTNSSDKQLELTFPNGQTHDFVVLDSAGRAVWRWSADRMFTQALRSQMLESGETTSFDGRWEPGAARGRFTAVASLKSENHPIETRVEFSLP